MDKNFKRKYEVEIELDGKTGEPVLESWTLDKVRHRGHGPAEQAWDPQTRVVIREAYFFYGELHRQGGPCLIERHRHSGEVISEEWAFDGGRGREGDLPALWKKDPITGVIVREEYWSCGFLHRDEGKPAVIVRDPRTGTVLLEKFYNFDEQISGSGAPRLPSLDP